MKSIARNDAEVRRDSTLATLRATISDWTHDKIQPLRAILHSVPRPEGYLIYLIVR